MAFQVPFFASISAETLSTVCWNTDSVRGRLGAPPLKPSGA